MSDRPRTLTHVAGEARPKTGRVAALTAILENYADLVDPMQSRAGTGDGEPVPLMPATYTRTVRELERLICQLRDSPALLTLNGTEIRDENQARVSCRKAWKHLHGWYLQAHRTTVEPVNVTARNRNRKQLRRPSVDQNGRPLRQQRVVRGRGARQPIAAKAVEWLAENWTANFEPELPVLRATLEEKRLGYSGGLAA